MPEMEIKKTSLNIKGVEIPVYALDTVVIGTGAAAYNAADWLSDYGRKSIAMITEGINMGTSRNTGSDKQTYYKLSLNSEDTDSVRGFAQTLFRGEAVNGDIALIEAACSVRSFIKLANLGVPFPTNEYGVYVGYKTDFDPMRRASSAGPLTSRYMTECLQKSVEKKGVKVSDKMQAVQIIADNKKLYGILAVNTDDLGGKNCGLTLFACNYAILATGGPAGAYGYRSYPVSHTGNSGMAFEAGADAVNLTEGQFEVASTPFPWAISGTYQQSIPRYIAVDKKGNEREFLKDYFDDPREMLRNVFLKGYQYPFDMTHVPGSSLIDLFIHHETVDLGNRVYMDFRREPAALEKYGFEILDEEAYQYLKKSNALLKTPIARLAKMNPRAINLFASNDLDLYKEPMEVHICSQHNNGGVDINIHWESTVKGLYCAGEAAGAFGVHRPGGCALNDSQVGSLRAAEDIACTSDESEPDLQAFRRVATTKSGVLVERLLDKVAHPAKESNVMDFRKESQTRMSAICAHINRKDELGAFYRDLVDNWEHFFDRVRIKDRSDIPALFKTRDIIITQAAIVSAVMKEAEEIGSRGTRLIASNDGVPVHAKLPYRMVPGKEGSASKQLVTRCTGHGFETAIRQVRPIPEDDNWFENAWNAFNERTARIYKHANK
jgi:succinate dehydrogenase/fumarate reductase flavoprotein subunit